MESKSSGAKRSAMIGASGSSRRCCLRGAMPVAAAIGISMIWSHNRKKMRQPPAASSRKRQHGGPPLAYTVGSFINFCGRRRRSSSCEPAEIVASSEDAEAARSSQEFNEHTYEIHIKAAQSEQRSDIPGVPVGNSRSDILMMENRPRRAGPVSGRQLGPRAGWAHPSPGIGGCGARCSIFDTP